MYYSSPPLWAGHCPCLSNLEELHIGMYFMRPLRLFLTEHRDPIRHQEEVMDYLRQS